MLPSHGGLFRVAIVKGRGDRDPIRVNACPPPIVRESLKADVHTIGLKHGMF